MTRLPKEAVKYIKSTKASYSEIIGKIQIEWNRRISKGHVSYYRGKRMGRIKPFHKENINPSDWDWLVGLYYTDGCKFKDRYHYAVVFTLSTSEKDIIHKLTLILTAMELKVGTYLKKNKKAVDIKTSSKRFFFALPNKEESYSPHSPLAYLAGLFDGDGYIGKHKSGEKWVFTQARYPHLVQQVMDIARPYGRVTSRVIYHPNSANKPTHKVLFLKETRVALLKTEFKKHCIRCYYGGRAGRI